MAGMEKVFGEWSFSGIWNCAHRLPVESRVQQQSLYYQAPIYQLRPTASLPLRTSATTNKVLSKHSNQSELRRRWRRVNFFAAPSYIAGPAFPQRRLRRAWNSAQQLARPVYNDVDASLTKAFGLPKMQVLGDDAQFEFRADAYNLFNKTNINGSSINNAIGTANPDGSVSQFNPNFGTANSELGARVVQLQARFSF